MPSCFPLSSQPSDSCSLLFPLGPLWGQSVPFLEPPILHLFLGCACGIFLDVIVSFPINPSIPLPAPPDFLKTLSGTKVHPLRKRSDPMRTGSPGHLNSHFPVTSENGRPVSCLFLAFPSEPSELHLFPGDSAGVIS